MLFIKKGSEMVPIRVDSKADLSYTDGYRDGINKAIDIHKDSEEIDFESLLLSELDKLMEVNK